MAKVHGFDASGARRIASVVKRVERQPRRSGGARGSGVDVTPPIWVRLTKEDYPANPGLYAWKLMEPEGSEFVDSDPLIDSGHVDPDDPESAPLYTAREINGGPGLAGRMAVLTWIGGFYTFSLRPRGVPVVVILEEDGPGTGSAASAEEASGGGGGPSVSDRADPVAYVYKVTLPDTDGLGPEGEGNQVVANNAAPLYRPFSRNVPSPASRGIGYFTVTDGSFVLLEAYETFGARQCATPPSASASA
jgi:hypothetical protein